jgi:hypothetical protein
MTAPWWTEADEAEARVIAWELNDLWRSDAPRGAKVEATEAALEWREHRHLLSEAKFLRALRNRLEGA